MKKFILLILLFAFAGIATVNAQQYYGWGLNSDGQVGENNVNKLMPISPVSFSGTWKMLSGGLAFSLGIKSDGTLWAWGSNTNGQLGTGNADPAVVYTPMQIGTDNNWAKVYAGYGSSLAIKTDGTLWAWGNNTNGQLGTGNTDYVNSPVQIGTDNNWKMIVPTSGDNTSSTFGVKTDGTLWTWGTDYLNVFPGSNLLLSPQQIPLVNNWNQICTSPGMLGGVKNDGSLWTWGSGSNGQLGNGSTNNSLIPVQIGGNEWASVSAQSYTVAAIKTDGSLWVWGANGRGQLGNGSTTASSSPIRVGSENNWNKVVVGNESILAMKNDSSLWACGYNEYGQIGIGNQNDQHSFVRVGPDVKWCDFDAGINHSSHGTGIPVPTIQTISEVSYIIPDIGTPGMNIYTEIIGPTSGFGNFGTDRVVRQPYTDNGLKIEFRREGDEKKLTFGPLNVSWDGRMISTQIFVNPSLPMPTTSFWNMLDTNNIVQFRAVSGANVSEWQKFYIVKPFHFGDLTQSPTEVKFGSGNLGIRSPRGAMIVDSLNLANITYTVDTTDCDPNTAGNQGFLPFVLLATGNITGQATINVAGNDANGGPGGGGGGGRFCDANLLNNGSKGNNGGSGYVSGGKGGYNNSGIPGIDNSWKSLGSGSGTAGNSLNGVVAPGDKHVESSGGGAGHPFGVSGRPAWVQTASEDNNGGGYGGGSGGEQKSRGGGAGYSSVGYGSNVYNAGRIYGNAMVVPIAGGSGGASGNPQGQGDCSGSGGGGGGAIRIFAKNIYNIIVNADGGNGGTSDGNTNGGGGSGGYCGIFVKTHAENVQTSVLGGYSGTSGTRNGAGRIRFDIIHSGIGISSNPSETYANHTGFATDTTSLVKRSCTIKGTKAANDVLTCYYKSLNSVTWLPAGTIEAGSTDWELPLNLVGTDTVYYFYAERNLSNAGRTDSCQYTPTADYSQAAANILRLDKFPELTCDSSSYIYVGSYCDGKVKYDTVQIKNTGLANLRVRLDNAAFIHEVSGFGFSPKEDMVIVPGASRDLIISYAVHDGQTGMFYDTLEFAHNDNTKENPWRLACSAKVDKVDVAFVNSEGEMSELDTVAICTFDSIKVSVKVKNKTSDYFIFGNTQFVSYGQTGKVSFAATPREETILPDSFSYVDLNIKYEFTDKRTGVFSDTLYLRADGCDDIVDTLLVNVHVYEMDLSIDDAGIDSVCAGEQFSQELYIRNRNLFDVYFDTEVVSEGHEYGFTFASSSVIFALDSAKLTWFFDSAGLPDGIYTGTITFHSTTCNSDFIVTKQIKVYHPEMTITSKYDFGEIPIGEVKDTLVTVYNTGSSPLYFSSLPTIGSSFTVLYSDPEVPVEIPVGDSIRFSVRFYPETAGFIFSSLIIKTSNTGTSCATESIVECDGYGAKTQVEISTSNMVFDNKFKCLTGTDSAFVINIGETDITVSGATIEGENKENFTFATPTTGNYFHGPCTLHAGDSVGFFIHFDATTSDYGKFNAKLKFTGSVPMPSVELYGETYQIICQFDPGPHNINLGVIPVGESKEIPIASYNTIDSNVFALLTFASKPGIAEVYPPTIVVAPRYTFNLFATVYATKPGWDTVAVYFTMFPCDSLDSLTFVYYGTGSNVIHDKYNWGTMTPCDVVHHTFYLKQASAEEGALTVYSIDIGGVDAGLFTLDSPYTYPITINSGDSLAIPVTFDVTATTEGVKTAEINCHYITSLGDEYYHLFEMTGEKKVGLTMPKRVAFDTTMVGETSRQTLTITNNSGYEMRVDSVRIIGLTSVYAVVMPGPDGTLIADGDSVHFEIAFAPPDSFVYEYMLRVYCSVRECPLVTETFLDGNGFLRFAVLHIELPNIVNADPAAANLDIPVTMYLEAGGTIETLQDADITFDVMYNAGLYYPRSAVPSGSSITINSDFGTGANVELHKLYITTEKRVVGTISGVPLLGDTAYTDLSVTGAKSDETKTGKLTMICKDGSLQYKICTSGGERLLKNANPMYVKILPNPPKDNKLKVEVSTLEKGVHTITIANETGAVVLTKIWTAENNSELSEFDFDISGLGSGTYFVNVKSSNNSATEKFQIVK